MLISFIVVVAVVVSIALINLHNICKAPQSKRVCSANERDNNKNNSHLYIVYALCACVCACVCTCICVFSRPDGQQGAAGGDDGGGREADGDGNAALLYLRLGDDDVDCDALFLLLFVINN